MIKIRGFLDTLCIDSTDQTTRYINHTTQHIQIQIIQPIIYKTFIQPDIYIQDKYIHYKQTYTTHKRIYKPTVQPDTYVSYNIHTYINHTHNHSTKYQICSVTMRQGLYIGLEKKGYTKLFSGLTCTFPVIPVLAWYRHSSRINSALPKGTLYPSPVKCSFWTFRHKIAFAVKETIFVLIDE